MNNVLNVIFHGRETKASNLWQYDYGQKLKFYGLNLPDAYEVHFANTESGESITMLGDADGVDIPDELLQTGKNIYVWVYLHTGEDDGETEYKAVIPVKTRAKPSNTEPTPVQQDVITQAIAALNAGVSEVEQIAESIPAGGSAGQVLAKASATDYDTEWVEQSGGISDMPVIAVDLTNAVGGAIVGEAVTSEPNYTPHGVLTTEKTPVVSDVELGYSYSNYKLTISGLTVSKATVVSDAAWIGTGVNLINQEED